MIVYYADSFNNLMPEPLRVLDVVKGIENETTLHRCPAFIDFYKNTFAICSSFDYVLDYDFNRKELNSPDYNQEYFDKYVFTRDINAGIFSYYDPQPFFVPDTESLVVELLPLSFPFTAPNYSVVPGVFDIGKHARALELAFKLDGSQRIVFERDKPVFLVKFHTNEKIVFKRFRKTAAFNELIESIIRVRQGVKRNKSLAFFYELSTKYKLKKQFLNLAKQNVID